ncbi:hypothetical protein TGAM01_v200969 [Trichoderma gamsii]|uniref:Uncharacterized protein n=1 Tax=Trichoderma gamsii TaxID=398673 RepID=A0A2P5A1X1_9HYPO|nr:hypothetical protein TGAM01_v200969 [Trichoderma gamsii]PON30529.1 hypothetical protein TGAM01_v200969 [Trichoderma gamsii]
MESSSELSEKKEEKKKTERPKKYAAIDALIFPAKAWTAGSLNAASYVSLTALPGAFARSNFVRIIPQDGRFELNLDFPWEQHGVGFRGREYQNRFFFKEDDLNIEALRSFWCTIQTFGHFVIWDQTPEFRMQEKWSEPYFMYNIGHDSPYGVSHADHLLGNQKKEERLGYHTILSQQQKIREFLNRPRSQRSRLWHSPSPRHDTAPMKRIIPSGLIEVSRQKKLKIGYLYGKSDKNSSNTTGKNNGPVFRESSFTIIPNRLPKYMHSRTVHVDWTVLVLSSSNFFKQPAQNDVDTDWKSVLSEESLLNAQTVIIVDAISKVENRWRDLIEYIGGLLVEDFMDPKSYGMLLFDDETFSRSRLYFWVIGCLNEFDISIEDDIKQWKLFRQARIDPRLELLQDSLEGGDIEVSNELAKLENLRTRGEEVRQGLEDLQAQFRTKLVTVQTLRDGLFNASALIESRSSTRLGKNVKLLTYVSIVYLPLAFCAALWAVPDISNKDTRTPFIITTILVGFATYIVVFNLENIVDILGKSYTGYRSRLLENMSEDHDSYWQSLRERFEEFPPNNEQRKPSEWWILRYQVQKWFRRAN